MGVQPMDPVLTPAPTVSDSISRLLEPTVLSQPTLPLVTLPISLAHTRPALQCTALALPTMVHMIARSLTSLILALVRNISLRSTPWQLSNTLPDSDRDGGRNMGAASNTGSGYNTGSHGTHTGTGSGLTGSSHTGTAGSGLTGSSNTGSGYNTGATGSHGTHTGTGSGLTGSSNTGSGYNTGATGSHGTHTGTGSGLTGSSHTVGSNTYTGPNTRSSGNTGTYGSSSHTGYGDSTNAGPHSPSTANKADPTVGKCNL